MTAEEWKAFSAKGRAARAAKIAKKKAGIVQAERLHKPRDEYYRKRLAERTDLSTDF